MREFKILSAFLFLISGVSFAQLGFGIKGGVNYAAVEGGGAPPDTKSLTTFLAGAYLEIPLPFSFILQPEVLFAKKGYVQEHAVTLNNVPVPPYDYKSTMTLSYLEVPVLLKYAFDFPVIQPSVYVGPALAILLSANENISFWRNDNYNWTGGTASLDPEVLFGASVRVAVIRIDARYSRGLVSIPRTGWGGFNRVWSVMAEVPLQ
jgi:hypothetical protein